jgi:hypothetical protein
MDMNISEMMKTLSDDLADRDHFAGRAVYWRIIRHPNRLALTIACMQAFDEYDYAADQSIPNVTDVAYTTEADAVAALVLLASRLRGISFGDSSLVL